MTRRTILKMTGLSLIGGVIGACGRSMAASDDSAKQSTTEEAAMASSVSVKVINDKGELVGPVTTARVVKSDEEWKKILTADQFKIARAKGTERAFCGNLLDNHKDGIYTCICCSLPLFASSGKFESGTGWPSFFQPVSKENVTEHVDNGFGMQRTEILCARCDCHLGHVFDDGPRPTGLRFCVNSESLKFVDADKLATIADPAAKEATTQAVKG